MYVVLDLLEGKRCDRSDHWDLLDTQLGVPRTASCVLAVPACVDGPATNDGRTTAAAVALDAERILAARPKTGLHRGGCQNYDPTLSTLNIRCRIIIGIQQGTIILTTTHHDMTKARHAYDDAICPLEVMGGAPSLSSAEARRLLGETGQNQSWPMISPIVVTYVIHYIPP